MLLIYIYYVYYIYIYISLHPYSLVIVPLKDLMRKLNNVCRINVFNVSPPPIFKSPPIIFCTQLQIWAKKDRSVGKEGSVGGKRRTPLGWKSCEYFEMFGSLSRYFHSVVYFTENDTVTIGTQCRMYYAIARARGKRWRSKKIRCKFLKAVLQFSENSSKFSFGYLQRCFTF